MIFQFTPLREGRRSDARRTTLLPDISIHAPPRGATQQRIAQRRDALFQFTPLREGRLALHQIDDAPGRISIHAPPRGATRNDRKTSAGYLISIHAPPRGATKEQIDELQEQVFQFTPLREGRHLEVGRLLCEAKISIHAPPRGATAKDMQFLQIFCSTLTNQHGLTIMPRNLSRLFW